LPACVCEFYKPPEPIALSQHVKECNEMVAEFVYPVFHSALFASDSATKKLI